MKKLVFLLLIFLPVAANASWGWSFVHYSFFYGGYINPTYGYAHNYEFLIDKGYKSCTVKAHYYGLAMSTSIHPAFREYGLRLQYMPPFLFHLPINHIIFPYFFLQGNYLETTSKFPARDLNFRPGLGFMTQVNPLFSRFAIKAAFQIGYTLSENIDPQGTGLRIELKIGIGINSQ